MISPARDAPDSPRDTAVPTAGPRSPTSRRWWTTCSRRSSRRRCTPRPTQSSPLSSPTWSRLTQVLSTRRTGTPEPPVAASSRETPPERSRDVALSRTWSAHHCSQNAVVPMIDSRARAVSLAPPHRATIPAPPHPHLPPAARTVEDESNPSYTTVTRRLHDGYMKVT